MPNKDFKERNVHDDEVSELSREETTEEAELGEEMERDEVKEVEKMARKDTLRVRNWRIAVTVGLLATAVAVTYSTFRSLKAKERENFETAFYQFSRTLGGAAISQQQNMRHSQHVMTNIISAYAETNNLTFPFVTVPRFESYAQDIIDQANIELFAVLMHVEEEEREEYIKYTAENYEEWVHESHLLKYGNLDKLNPILYNEMVTRPTPDGFVPDEQRDDYWLAWQFSPAPSSYALINFNLASVPDLGLVMGALKELQNETVFTNVRDTIIAVPTAMTYEEHEKLHSKLEDSSVVNPHSFAYYPIHSIAGDDTSEVVGALSTGVAWDVSLLNLLPDGVKGIHTILKNDCDQTFTYLLDGPDAFYIGEGDLHDTDYDYMGVFVDLSLHSTKTFESVTGHCRYSMTIYPSATFQELYDSNTPETFAIVVALTFVIVAFLFFIYDLMVFKRNRKLVFKAAQTNRIITSLFPDTIRDRLMDDAENGLLEGQERKGLGGNSLKAFLNSDSKHGQFGVDSKPLADLFLDTTVLMADIQGFTSWSSVREPSQVFTLLETVYKQFDDIAKRRRVFKVETIGDCYVAVCGLPVPRADHAIAMTRFAKEIIKSFAVMSKKLEVSLGPDTCDLALRIGVHSGPVTAGVLRGEKARFQLFGDTMNTCARIESTGVANRIHCSKETADLLARDGKSNWLEPRGDKVVAKGKGELVTFFVTVPGERNSVHSDTESASISDMLSSAKKEQDGSLALGGKYHHRHHPGLDEKASRLVDWNVEMLLGLIKQVAASRTTEASPSQTGSPLKGLRSRKMSTDSEPETATTPLEEVKEIIHLPEFDGRLERQNPEAVEIPAPVVSQLYTLVSEIALMYNDNPFHNFQHASHVVMSVIKLMSRIVAPQDDVIQDLKASNHAASSLHDHTYGITSDPLTQLACAFSALIHDVDHSGVSNAQLVKEGLDIASKYSNRSVAEQNSLDLSWELMMEARFDDLRAFLFPTKCELDRFRQLVVNSVMSTDLVDKELKALRNSRWDKAFRSNECYVDDNPKDCVNRKATIVIEHIIQASDISHTMQHWKVYRKWNRNLFEELYLAYLHGRMDKDPSNFWYDGEIGFFDFYIIPLTKKLKECGVFGVSSGEYLSYALKNREQWITQGKQVVAELTEEAQRKYGVKGNIKDPAQRQLESETALGTVVE